MKLYRALVPATILTTIGVAHAQQSAIQQLQNMQQQQLAMPQPELRAGTNAPELYTGENNDIGPQHILRVGTTQSAPRRKYIDGMVDSQIFYSDNARYDGAENRIGSWVFVNTIQVALAPDAYDVGPGKFAPALGFSSQWYNYSSGQMSSLDFNAQTAFANLRYMVGYWQFNLGANFTRLLNQENNYDETYREWLPNFSVQRAIPISDSMAFIVGDAISYHFTEVPQIVVLSVPQVLAPARADINDHFDNTFFASFNWQPNAHIIVQPFYRFQYSDYKNATAIGSIRNDYLNAVGITLMYNFNPNVSVRTFYSYTTKSTDDPGTTRYDEMNGGIGATLDIRF